jgi:hypothetical protein
MTFALAVGVLVGAGFVGFGFGMLLWANTLDWLAARDLRWLRRLAEFETLRFWLRRD